MNDIQFKKAQDWLKSKNQTFSTGVDIYNDIESEYSNYFAKQNNVKKGTFAHNLLVKRLQRQVRIYQENQERSKKKGDNKAIKDQEQSENKEDNKNSNSKNTGKNKDKTKPEDPNKDPQ